MDPTPNTLEDKDWQAFQKEKTLGSCWGAWEGSGSCWQACGLCRWVEGSWARLESPSYRKAVCASSFHLSLRELGA